MQNLVAVGVCQNDPRLTPKRVVLWSVQQAPSPRSPDPPTCDDAYEPHSRARALRERDGRHPPRRSEADLWSVGVVAYTLLSGAPSYRRPGPDRLFASDPVERARAVLSVAFDAARGWGSVSAGGATLARALLARDEAAQPSARGAVAAARRLALRGILR